MPGIDSLSTPCLLLDRARLEANCRRIRDRAAALGVTLRPHVKTAKSPQVARVALGGDKGPITVSTLKEAEHFSAHGFDDILYAVAITPSKLARVDALLRSGCGVSVITDDVETARHLSLQAFANSLDVLVEVDVGEGRGGFLPGDPAIVDVARLLDAGRSTRFAGVVSHSGHTYSGRSEADMARIAERERTTMVDVVGALDAAGIATPVVSVGSTPAIVWAKHLKGVTEVRAGVYMFGDLFQARINSHTADDMALSVLTEVIGRKPADNRLLVDAGALALSKDLSAGADDPGVGFGLVRDIDGGPLPGNLHIARVYQEHGVVAADAPIDFDAYPIGRRLRVVINHACMTAAAYDEYNVTENGVVVAAWPRINGWA